MEKLLAHLRKPIFGELATLKTLKPNRWNTPANYKRQPVFAPSRPSVFSMESNIGYMQDLRVWLLTYAPKSRGNIEIM